MNVSLVGTGSICAVKHAIRCLTEQGIITEKSVLVSQGKPGIQLLAESFWKRMNQPIKDDASVDVLVVLGDAKINHTHYKKIIHIHEEHLYGPMLCLRLK